MYKGGKEYGVYNTDHGVPNPQLIFDDARG